LATSPTLSSFDDGVSVNLKPILAQRIDALGGSLCNNLVPPTPEGWHPYEPGDPLYELDSVFLCEQPQIFGGAESGRGARLGSDAEERTPLGSADLGARGRP
jgi:hypothetical protein